MGTSKDGVILGRFITDQHEARSAGAVFSEKAFDCVPDGVFEFSFFDFLIAFHFNCEITSPYGFQQSFPLFTILMPGATKVGISFVLFRVTMSLGVSEMAMFAVRNGMSKRYA